ncbi:ATP-dependent RNA helicase HrpA [Jonesia quinghaiensis]|uniref:ATP-dependent RNA helicase HrpA n=1 Tax=Jonesia quinghaiensis TaxID=262806 RepID=UPI00146D9F40|nr:ATP-dependent RNA helicase HrpA [Jonesia quinghaiensis]
MSTPPDPQRSQRQPRSDTPVATANDAKNVKNGAGSQSSNRRRGPRRGPARNAQRDQHSVGTPHVNLAALRRRAEHRARIDIGTITYPEALPVSAQRARIATALAEHQVIIVAGETGSGKTTQIPKIALELGRGRAGQIGHTQPRRIAARSVAERIAEELGTTLGKVVGYQVRFTDESSEDTLVKVMTDGILLAQIQRDPQLLAYDTLIIDEAHERSLNIDFLLGYLTNLLPQRPDLKVIITSATIDSQRFAEHFAAPGPNGERGPEAVAAGLSTPAPVIEVSGRTFPVEVRYRPLDGESLGTEDGTGKRGNDDPDLMTSLCAAADELMAEGPGDILVFLSGERDIHDAHDALASHLGARATDPRQPGYTEIVPLFSRLSAAEQHRIFQAHSNRRIVLATNIAETSLTVPGIRYVIDPGTARISRYSKATKVQRLPIERISQASANQRSGRCGRVAEGIAIRLYSEEDFESRPAFTEPEILRTSLASVILHMVSVGVVRNPNDLAGFPFVDQPDTRAIRDGVALLQELSALTSGKRGTELTPVGRQLAQLPIDPRLARMIIEAQRRGCARDVMIVTAALSIQDPRERPSEAREDADTYHRRFVDGHSDFLSYLNLWEYLRAQQRALSSSAFRRMCRSEYLNFLRIREWQDVVSQLRDMTRSMGIDGGGNQPQPVREAIATSPSPSRNESGIVPTFERESGHNPTFDGGEAREPQRTGAREPQGIGQRNEPDAPTGPDTRYVWNGEAIHRSILAGLLSQIGMQEATEVATHKTGRETSSDRRAKRMARNEYLGSRGTRFAIFPGSPLSKKPPAWVMSAQLVETSRLWARDVAKIEPEWAEELATGIVKRTYSDPAWSTKRGAAMVREKVMLYGVPIVTDRPILYSHVDKTAARDMFVRHALVEGQWSTHHGFWRHNKNIIAEVEEFYARTRATQTEVDDTVLFEFYDARIPDSVVSAAHFDRWWKGARRDTPGLLNLHRDDLLPPVDDERVDALYPTVWRQKDLTFPITYSYTPGAATDGLTVHIPIQVLNRVEEGGFDWLVPGLLTELCTATIKALPKTWRRELVPAPDTARAIAAWITEQHPDWEALVHQGDSAPQFTDVFTQAAYALRNVDIPPEAFNPAALPAHVHILFSVETTVDRGKRSVTEVLEQSTSLTHLKKTLAAQSKEAVSSAVHTAVSTALAEARANAAHLADKQAGADATAGAGQQASAGETGASSTAGATTGGGFTGTGVALTTWPADYPTLPDVLDGSGPGGFAVRGYPALSLGSDNTVTLDVLTHPDQQRSVHGRAVVELIVQATSLSTSRITTRWTPTQALTFATSPYPSNDVLVMDLQRAAVQALLPDAGGIRDADAYRQALATVRQGLEDETYRVAKDIVAALAATRELDVAIKKQSSLAMLATLKDIRSVRDALVYDGFISATPPDQVRHLVRFIRAQVHRLEKAADSVHRDNEIAWRIANVVEQYERAVAAKAASPTGVPPALAQVRWMIEELRVSMFAQHLGTDQTVSEKRILKAITAASA